MKVIFMGTPDFAAGILKELCNNFSVSAVFTQPDKPQGRKMTLTAPPVKVLAESLNIPVYQPLTLKDNSILPILKEYSPDVIVVAAYGKILPSYVLEYPKYGCINVHASLLPKYRGAAPIQRAIMDGEKVSGVTTMYMAEGLDTGDMLEWESVEITDDDNFETLHDKLCESGKRLIVSTLNGLFLGTIIPTVQNDSLSTYAAKIENTDCVIDFSETARCVFNKIRGLSPIPLATCKKNGKSFKIIEAKISNTEKTGSPGEVLSTDGGVITVSCIGGAIDIYRLQPEGKKKMSSADFINGRGVAVGEIFE